ncbi:calpain-A-like [Aphidius gifuensis]|uniref:calpain-A-like n=1 Tax=Aphidius gifuensis TaxID=684658 RepID=UPI001CDB9E02|nr:calpain-A-like [Aphidius gifuensis]
MPVENVQLMQYIDGEFVRLQQQDYNDLLEKTRKSGELFKDRQFPTKLSIFSYKRPTQLSNNPVLFIENKRDRSFHLRQRLLGDCWFLVGLLNLKYHENLFNFIVPSSDQSFEENKYAGIFHFRFWQAGKWVDIVIDDRLQTVGKFLWYTSLKSSNEFWVPLIEKAYAKLNYRSYKKLEGGFASIAMQDLSGCIPEVYIVAREYKTLFEIIYNAKIRQTMISCGSYNEETLKKKNKKNSLNIVLGHYYAITAVKIIKKKTDDREFKLIRINNPHGSKVSIRYPRKIKKIYTEFNEINRVAMKSELQIQVDGESWILYEDFIDYFETVEICNLTPNSVIGDIYTVTTNKKLSLSAKEGIFMGGTSSKVVKVNDVLTMKPQYRIVLTEPDEGQENDNTCSILISLSLKYQRDLENFISTKLDITILSFNETEENKLQKPLRNYLLHGPSYSNYITSMSGQLSNRLTLKLGTYYILPSIRNNIKGATFYLQIMSEQENILE